MLKQNLNHTSHFTHPTSNKGITLIALIITIIVMLILVAVTISMAINGGLFEKAGKAVGDTKNAIKEENSLSNLDQILNKYLTGDSNDITSIIGKLDVTYKVEGTKVYFYPSIGGYNSVNEYCEGKVKPTLENITTVEGKEKFIINCLNIVHGANVNTPEEALEFINNNSDEPLASCIEAFDGFINEIQGDPMNLLIGYYAVILDDIPETDIDELVLYGFNYMQKINGTWIRFESIEDLLKYINESNNSSYNTLKEAMPEDYFMFSALGLWSCSTEFELESKSNSTTYSAMDVLSGDSVVMEAEIGSKVKYSFIISNGFESKKIEIKKDSNRN